MDRESRYRGFRVRTHAVSGLRVLGDSYSDDVQDRTGRSVAHVSAMPVFYTNFSTLIDVWFAFSMRCIAF